MHPELRALAARQGGVFRRQQALALGCTEREIRTRTGPHGDWTTVRRGVYAETSVWRSAGTAASYRMRVRAGLLGTRTMAVASHASAAAMWGLPLRPRWCRLVHLTRRGEFGARVDGGIKHHLCRFLDDEVELLEGAPVFGMARTAVDIGREFGFEDGVVAADAALRRGASREDMVEEISRMEHWPRITAARAAVSVADGGAHGIGETLLRLLILELGIGPPETQFVITDGRRRAEVDIRVGRHLFEFDGKVKYLGRERGGVADVPAHEVVWREKQREDFCRNHDGGFGMSRVIWSELFGTARKHTMRRLADEYAASQRLFGHRR